VRSFYDWMRGHPLVVDSLLAFAVAVAGVSVGVGGARHVSPAVVPLFKLAMAAPVALRRRYPVGAFAAVVVVGGLEILTSPRPVGSDLAVIILLYTVAAYRPRSTSLPALAICLIGSLVATIVWAPSHVDNSMWAFAGVAAVFAGPALLAWLLGDSMQWRRGYYRGLEERAARAERERDAQSQIAVAAERARIARELHDVVAHHVSVMVVQADGAAFALKASPEQAQQALAAISGTGRQALAEMRRLLGVLRSADDSAELEPQPGVEQLAGLLEQARASGLPVSFAVEGVPRSLPPGAALAAYRIVQESLTNARKHGGATVTASVTLLFCEKHLAIKVTDDGSRTGTAIHGDGRGHGLIGMRERVEVYGGSVSAGPWPGGWRVIATLPLPAGQGAA
jgi:signal transduction histidine kinase